MYNDTTARYASTEAGSKNKPTRIYHKQKNPKIKTERYRNQKKTDPKQNSKT
jgi:hypothetical protein